MNLFIKTEVTTEEMSSIKDFFEEFDKEVKTVAPEEVNKETPVTKYISSLVTSCYEKSIEDIANTKIGNKVVRKRNLQQVMRESFFYGSNRFGNNFIA